MRGHAAWALGQIGSVEAREGLEKAIANENEADVQEEIRLALAECASSAED